MARVLVQQGLVVVVTASEADPALLAWNRANLPGYREVCLRASSETIKHRARRRRSIDGVAPALAPSAFLVPILSNAALPDRRMAGVTGLAMPEPDLVIDMDNPEPPELLAFRVAVLVPEFLVVAAGAAGVGTQRLRRGA